MTYATRYLSSVGPIVLASDGENLIGLWFDDQKHFGAGVDGEITERPDLPVFALVRDWLDKYFAGRHPVIDAIPCAPRGGAFRQSVWKILCEIPYGSVMTYGEIAEKLGCKSARAIGNAVGHNPISIIIPCHRVVGTGGSLTGYAGGIDKKIKLLKAEGLDLTKFTTPPRQYRV